MKQISKKPEEFYNFLELDWIYSLFVILFIFTNLCLVKITISNEIIGISITMFSIVYGFLVSSVLNLYGRSVVKAMQKQEGLQGKSQLGLFKISIVNFIKRGVVFISISLVLIIARLVFLDSSTCLEKYMQIFELVLSGYIISQLMYITYSMYYYFKLIMNMLINETILNNSNQ